MSYELDDNILQDFLVEVGEILELLSEQLVELENNPEDTELLNAIFRGFHTVKGGAGFLSLTELVDICHGAESVFDGLRNGHRSVTPELMDVVLQALDAINVLFTLTQEGQPLIATDPVLLEELERLSSPASTNESASVLSHSESNTEESHVENITEDEFEKLLDELHGSKDITLGSNSSDEVELASSESEDAKLNPSDITDDEFEQLLDDLHGKGNAPNVHRPVEASKSESSTSSATDEDDAMTDEEFESLLEQLHGTEKSVSSKDSKDSKVIVSSGSVSTSAPKPLIAQEEKSQPQPKKPTGKSSLVKSKPEVTVRVDTSTLDNIMNMIGELVLIRNRLVSLGMNQGDEEVSKAVTSLDIITVDLQGAVMKTRMQPVKKIFGRFPRIVRDLARSLQKEIVIEMHGEETDLDKNLVEALADPLIHLIRNSVDHGIEMPDIREKLGKPRVGKITLSALQKGDHIELMIADDGAGMSADRFREIAVSRGIMDSDSAKLLTDKECFNLIFSPGFSSKEKISDISGRGVGMDVVKTAISALNGFVDIDSEVGKGTKITIKMPLTLAILPALMVGICEQPFALPLSSVNEIFNLESSKTNVIDGQLTVVVRGKSIPLFYLQDWLVPKVKLADKREKYGHVVVAQIGNQRAGFVVDSLIGQEEVVIKPLDKLLQGTPGISGATISSSGDIALILDIASLLKEYVIRSRIREG